MAAWPGWGLPAPPGSYVGGFVAEEHAGVWCDGNAECWGLPIKGTRHRCLTCGPGTDFCSACAGEHARACTGHLLLRQDAPYHPSADAALEAVLAPLALVAGGLDLRQPQPPHVLDAVAKRMSDGVAYSPFDGGKVRALAAERGIWQARRSASLERHHAVALSRNPDGPPLPASPAGRLSDAFFRLLAIHKGGELPRVEAYVPRFDAVFLVSEEDGFPIAAVQVLPAPAAAAAAAAAADPTREKAVAAPPPPALAEAGGAAFSALWSVDHFVSGAAAASAPTGERTISWYA
jgi:hypothetical protein